MLPNFPRAKELLVKDNVDFVVVTSPSNVCYFGQQRLGIQGVVGWWNAPKMVLLPVSKAVKPVLVVNVMDAWDVIRARDNPCDPRFYGGFVLEFGKTLDEDMEHLKEVYQKSQTDQKDSFRVLDEFLSSWDGQSRPLTVGLEGQHLPSMARDILTNKYSDIHFKNIDETLRRIRMIKTEEEIERIKQSSAINIRGFRAAVQEMRPGAKEGKVGQAYLAEISKWDAHPCYIMISAGPRSSALFPSYNEPYKIKKNDTVRIDVGCEYKGYCSDVSRTVAVGNISDEKKKIIRATTRGYVETIKLLKPGWAIKDLFDHAVSTVKRAGIPNYRRTNVGHGLGIDVHDLPDLVSQSGDVLERDMVLNVETPYYCFGVGGFPGEDTARITENSYELLTHLERIIEV
jgi:Xaa-Pro aminopeptidase